MRNCFLDQHYYMTHSYTSNQIIQYLYRELPLTDHLETEYAISADHEWEQTYLKLREAFISLPKVQFFPAQKVIRSILSYSSQN